MITGDLTAMNSPVRSVKARVELFEGSTLVSTFTQSDRVKEITIERVGDETKFFGYGISQKANIKLIDKERTLDISTANTFRISFAAGEGAFINPFPIFKVTEVNRDENTNELSITAYDCIYTIGSNPLPFLEVENFTPAEIVSGFCTKAGLTFRAVGFDVAALNEVFPFGGNYEGSELIRDALNHYAEIAQAIFYVTETELVMKRLDKDGAAVVAIDKSTYFDLDSKTNRRLATIAHTNDLGDDVSASTAAAGSTQFIRNNPFYELREDIGDIIIEALLEMGGFTINQFECEWRGNYLLEIGDKISLTTKDNDEAISYLLNDTLEYNGALKQKTRWIYTNSETETAENPTSLGEALRETYARVDKINKQIDLVASAQDELTEQLAGIQVTTDTINASVTRIEQLTTETLEGVTEELGELRKEVDAAVTEDEVRFIIQSELSNGVDKVTTSTGFTFNEMGLTVNKSDSEMKTTITEDGMTVYKNDDAVLVANNEGVMAKNLHATTYLVIGQYSRFEDYNKEGEGRTGCFWIGP